MFVQRYDTIFKWGVAIWEGPIAYRMFGQFLKTNVRPLHYIFPIAGVFAVAHINFGCIANFM
jgi:hypothetical protein